MKLDMSKVYTAVNADELKDIIKEFGHVHCIVGDTLAELREGDTQKKINMIHDDWCKYRFVSDDDEVFMLAYLLGV